MAVAIFKSLGAVALPVLPLAMELRSASPDPDLMYAIAQVGIAIVFAFVVEAVWLVERANRDADDHRDFLGITCGMGIAGLAGVSVALMVGAHRAAGHANLLDSFGLSWSVVSLVLLGALVVVQPLLVDERRSAGDETPG